MTDSHGSRAERATELVERLVQKASVTDAELAQLQQHVDELKRYQGSSVHHHEDQNLEE